MDEADQIPTVAHHHARHKRHRSTKYLIAIAVVIILAVAVFLFYSFSGSSINITAAHNLTVTSAGVPFMLEGNQYIMSLAGSAQGTVYIYLSKTPIFVNRMAKVALSEGNITKINYGYEYANMGLQLESHNSTSAIVQVTPLFQSLAISPDSQKISYINYNGTSATSTPSTYANQPTTTNSTTSTNTIPASKTTTPTTTVENVNTTLVSIDYALYNDSYYALMMNMSALYSNSIQCSSSTYNTTYIRTYSSAPRGPSSYNNMSMITPTSLKQSISKSGSDYVVEYTALSNGDLTNGMPAVSITIDPSTRTIVSDVINNPGLFAGETESEISSGLANAKSLGNACGVLIA
jgi:hypothetical protein